MLCGFALAGRPILAAEPGRSSSLPWANLHLSPGSQGKKRVMDFSPDPWRSVKANFVAGFFFGGIDVGFIDEVLKNLCESKSVSSKIVLLAFFGRHLFFREHAELAETQSGSPTIS